MDVHMPFTMSSMSTTGSHYNVLSRMVWSWCDIVNKRQIRPSANILVPCLTCSSADRNHHNKQREAHFVSADGPDTGVACECCDFVSVQVASCVPHCTAGVFLPVKKIYVFLWQCATSSAGLVHVSLSTLVTEWYQPAEAILLNCQKQKRPLSLTPKVENRLRIEFVRMGWKAQV